MQLKFELDYCDVTVQYISHYAIGTTPLIFDSQIKFATNM